MPVTPSTRNYEEGERERQARMAEWSRLMTARSHPVDINAYRNLGMGGEITEGLQRGGGNIASMLGGLGNLASEGLGDRLAAYGAEVAARHPRSAEFQGRSIATDPSLLLSPRYLAGTAAEALPQFLPSLATGAGAAALTGRLAAGAIARGMSPAVARMLAGAAGTAVGGAPLEMGGVMNEAATLGKSREEQVNAALLAGAASIPLNLAGGAAIFSPARLLPRMGLSALTEGTTEGTEEEVQAAILGQPLGRSFPEAAIGGAILGPLGSAAYGGPSAAPPLAAQETLPEPSTLATPPSLRPEGAPVAPTAPPASTPLTDRQEAILAHLAALNEPPPPPAAPPSPLQRLAGQPSAAAHTAAVPPVELFAEPSAAAHQAATQAPPMVPVYGTEGDLTGFRVVPQATPEISPFNATSMQAIQRALGIASFERDYGALSQPDAPVIPPQAAPAVQIPSAGVPAGPFNTSMADALARARHAAPQPAAETFESLLENYLPPARAGRVPTTGTANARENMAAILSQAAQELRDRAAAIPAAAAKPQPAGDLNAPQDTQATPRDGGGVPREEQPRNPEGGRLRNAPLEGQPAPVQPVREEAGQGVPQAQVQQEAPKQEAVLAEPAAFKQEITLSERWDSAKLGKRVEWVRRAGWVTKKGGLSRLGEGISEGKWDGLSPAARNVLTPRIAEDYPALRTEPTAAGEQDIPPEKITTEVPQAETGFLPEARPEEAPTLPEASPGATEAAPAEAKTTTEPAQAEPPQVAETFAERLARKDKEDVERAKEQLAREMADLARLKKNDPSFVNPYRTKEEGIRNAQSKIRDLRSEIRKKAPSDFENFATRPPDFGPVSSSKMAPKNSMMNAGEQYITTKHWFFKRGVFKNLDAREKTAGFNPDVAWGSLRLAEFLDKKLRLPSSAAMKLDGYVRFTDRTGAVLSNDNDTAVINSNYYDYIVKHAPKGGVEFRPTGEGTPVLIFHKGEAIGGVMPLTPPKGWANTLRSAKPTAVNDVASEAPYGGVQDEDVAQRLELDLEALEETARAPLPGGRVSPGVSRSPVLRAIAMVRTFKEAHKLDWVGRTLSSLNEIAVALQITRNPSFETFRIIYMRGQTVVGHEALSARDSRYAPIFLFTSEEESALRDVDRQLKQGPKQDLGARAQIIRANAYASRVSAITSQATERWLVDIRSKMASLGADGYYLSHNHPSGVPQPSSADRAVTTLFAQKVPGFLAHVIVDSGKYAVLQEPGGSPREAIVALEDFHTDPLLTPSVWNVPFGTDLEFTDSAQVATALKQLQTPDGFVEILFRASTKARAIMSVHVDTFTSPEFPQWITDRRNEFGASSAITYYPQSTEQIFSAGMDWVRQGVLLDHIQVTRSGGVQNALERVTPSRSTEIPRSFRVQDVAYEDHEAEPTTEAEPTAEAAPHRAFTGVPSQEDVRALVKSTRAAFHWLFAQATAPTPAQSSVSSTSPGRPSPLRQATAPTPAQSSVLGTAGVNPSIFATDNRLARFIRDHNWSVLNIDPRLKLFMRQVRAGEHQTQAKTLTMVQGMMGLTEDDAVAMSAIIEGVPNGDYGVDQNAARERVEEDVNQIRAEIRRDEAELRELNMLDSTLEEGTYLSRVYDKKTKTFREIWNHPAVLGIKGGELSPRGTDTTVHVPESRRVTMDKGEMFDAESLAWDERVLAVRKNKGSDVYIIGRIKLSPTRQLFATPRTIGSKRGQRELDVRGIRHVAKDVYSVTLHRDYTTQERTGMGENRDARLRFAQGRLLVARDLAMGRLFKNIQDEAPDLWMDPDPEAGLPDGWHELPKSLGTRGGKAKRYGVLAGKWVHPDVYRLLTTHTGGRRFLDHPGVKRWRAVQGIWKRAKAPLAPVVHANNITTSAVQAFIGPTHGVLPGAKIYRDVFRDLRRGGPLTQKWRSHFADTDFLSAEGAQSNLRQEMESMFPRLLEPSEPGSAEEGLGRVWGASLRGMERLYRVTGAKRYVDVASRLYRAEDFFFKMVIAENAVRHGLSVDRAVQEANDAIFDYTDMPPWAEGVRDFAIPFFAYSLKASHSLALSMASHPVRVAEVAGALWAMNLLGIMSDGSDFDEEKEARKVMPEWMRGYSALGTPAFIRIPRFGAERNQYFDVTRKLPLGDMFATHSGTGGLPWMRAIYPNNPVISMFQGLVANRDSFTGREVFNKSDDPVTRAAKAAEFTYRQLMPNLPFLPGTYAYDKVVNGLARDMGRPVLGHTGQRREGEETDGLLAATAHTLLGLNTREVNVKEERANRIAENERKAAAVKADMTRAKKDHTLTPERRQGILDRKRRQLGDLTQQKARLRAGGAP